MTVLQRGAMALWLALLISSTSNAAAVRISAETVRKLQLNNAAIVIDVRPPGDFSTGHIQGALNRFSSALETSRFPVDAKVIVYCSEDSCAYSDSAAAKLIKLGYKDVSILNGGFNDWLKNGYPAQAGAPPRMAPVMLTVGRASEKIKAGQILVLDVRPAIEFPAGHLPGAKSAPLEQLDTLIADLPKNQEVLVYDRHSERSRGAAEKLINAGYKTFELAGGFVAWVKKGQALEVK